MNRKPFLALRNAVNRSPLLAFSLTLLLLILILSITLSLFLERQVRASIVTARVTLYPEILSHALEMHPTVLSFLDQTGRQPDAEARAYFREVRDITGAERLKLWSTDFEIIWSDADEAIGAAYPENALLRRALSGDVVYELEETDAAENISEEGFGRALEVYVPVTSEGEVLGAIELYNQTESLFARIARARRGIWLSVGLGGAILYVSLFGVFFRSHRRQRAANQDILRSQDATIYALAYQAEQRDELTGRHLERTTLYVDLLLQELRKSRKYRSYLTVQYSRDLLRAAPLHDIGKVGVSDAILRKPGKLTEEEFDLMKLHTRYGAETLRRVEERLGVQTFLSIAVQVVRHHHERWDGGGYPDGLAGEDIPLSARIMAVADVYDALRSRRPYKEEYAHEVACRIIEEERGRQFDPDLVDAFLARQAEFERISEGEDEELAVSFALVRGAPVTA